MRPARTLSWALCHGRSGRAVAAQVTHLVVGAPNDEWGEEVRAVVELKPGVAGDAATAADIIEYCRTKLARYKCPAKILFVDELPRNVSGKLLRRDLV